MEKDNKKIITVLFVIAGFLAALVISVLIESFAASFGFIAKLYAQDSFKHGLPVIVGLATFASLQFNKKVLVWADEVVVEIKKVVWPTKQNTFAMTTVTCVMLVVAGLLLGFFDFVSSSLVKMLVN